MNYIVIMLLIIFPSLVISAEKIEKIENCPRITSFEKLKAQINDFEQSVQAKKQKLKQLYKPEDFAQRQHILVTINAQKKTIQENIERSYHSGKINQAERSILMLNLDAIQ